MSKVNTDRLNAYIESLQDQPRGEGFRGKDFFILGLLGLVVPTVLLIWGIV